MEDIWLLETSQWGDRQLNNVGMPMENHQASNKFYVDTLVETATAGDKALRKIQDGIFASSGEIDMSGNSITGLPNPIETLPLIKTMSIMAEP